MLKIGLKIIRGRRERDKLRRWLVGVPRTHVKNKTKKQTKNPAVHKGMRVIPGLMEQRRGSVDPWIRGYSWPVSLAESMNSSFSDPVSKMT